MLEEWKRMSYTRRKDIEKWMGVATILIGILVLYSIKATYSGLWYDESVEYFYSKVMNGTVPGGLGTNSMYERICSTYQPPLYNWMMHLWLTFFDSEFGFRFAGVITTVIGGCGFFLAANKLMDDKWAMAGTCTYLLSSSVSYYALECAEYNLMLCFLCWTLYFFVSALKEEHWGQILGFFIFSCLTMYSQYGAVFVIVPSYIALVVHFLKKKEKLGGILLLSVVAAALGIILICLFAYPQMCQQGTVSVSHAPYFAHNNVILDFILSIAKQLSFSFNGGRHITTLIAVFAALMTLMAAKKKNRLLIGFICICIVSWLIYYAVVACSFYGYNSWSLTMGTQNIGNRYGLAFVPFWILLLNFGVYSFWKLSKEKCNARIAKLIQLFSVSAAVVFCIIGVRTIFVSNIKDDIREVTKAWYVENASESRTLVHQWDDANFQFYLTQNSDYSESYQSNIEAAGLWIRSATENEFMEELEKMGYFSVDDFYYICPCSGSYDAFLNVMNEKGYLVDVIYEGKSALLHLVKKES